MSHLLQELEKQVSELGSARSELESIVEKCRTDLDSLRLQLEQTDAARLSENTAAEQRRMQQNRAMLGEW